MRNAGVLLALCLALGAVAGVAAPVTGIYTGVLPCADCEGISYRLHLRPDRAFVLETQRLGRGAGTARAVLGVWAESADDRTVVLRQTGEPPLFFAIASPGVLRKLDAAGLPIASKANHDLVRSTTVEPFRPLLSLQGMYTYMADAGVFRECLSRARFPVDPSGDNAALERGYVAARAEPGSEVLVTIDARIAARPSAEGDRLEDALFVEKFRGAWPGETCGDPLATADLAGTRWVLTRIGDQPVVARPGTEAPHLRFAAKGGEVTGFSGCNRFMGAYKTTGASMDLGRLASTMMACERMDQEQAFLEALRDARSWKIFGEHLELYDRDGGMVARFEARYEK